MIKHYLIVRTKANPLEGTREEVDRWDFKYAIERCAPELGGISFSFQTINDETGEVVESKKMYVAHHLPLRYSGGKETKT